MSAPSGLSDVCRRLGADPLFSVSRASKELFHTNLLGWLAEQYPEVFIAAFEQWLIPDAGRTARSVSREWHHLDLVVELPGYTPLVVEAKVFSLPDERQLSVYSDLPAVRNLGPHAVALLLTLDMPHWMTRRLGESGQEWMAVRLDELAPGLLRAATDKTFDHEVIRREAALLRLLVELHGASALGSGDEFFFMQPSERDVLVEYRLDLPVQKARASRFRGLVAERLDACGIAQPSHELWAGASHGTALTSALWSDDEGDGVGWQVQGGRWTLALLNQSRSARFGHARGERLATAERNREWFDFDIVRDHCGETIGPELPREGFNRYDPDFVYRSVKLPEDVSVKTMLDLAESYSRRAATYSFIKDTSTTTDGLRLGA